MSIREVTIEEFKTANPDGVLGFQTFYKDGILVQRKIYENGYTEEARGVTKYFI